MIQQIKIRKRSLPEILTLYLYITPFLLNFLLFFLHFPSFVKYTLDIAWIAILLWIFLSKAHYVHKKTTPMLVFLAVYLLFVSIVYLFEYQSVFYFLWGIRNNVRYYVAFLAFVYFLSRDSIAACLKFIDLLFAVHVVASFVQFFILGYQWDYLGGIFGTQLGCNGNSMLFLTVVCIKSLLMFMHGEEKLPTCLIKCGLSIIIAVLAEVKFFFVLFLIILAAATLITRFSAKKILLIAGTSVVLFFAGVLFTSVWGEDHALTFRRIWELVTSANYSSTRDLGRVTAIPIISNTILEDLPHKLFGLGLGNCETSSFAICNTPFYRSHSYLNYSWLSSAFAFIETGYVGLGLLLSFFGIVFLCARRMKRRGEGNELYAEMAMIMSVACVGLVFYNSSLRTDIGYIAYFVLALPFASTTGNSVYHSAFGQSNSVYARHGA